MWLSFIELPEDRKKEPKALSSEETREVAVIRIPCDDKLPIELIRISIPRKSTRTDQLVIALRSFFKDDAPSSSIDDNLLQDALGRHFANRSISLNKNTLASFSKEGSVEVFPLTKPNESNDYCGMNLYLG